MYTAMKRVALWVCLAALLLAASGLWAAQTVLSDELTAEEKLERLKAAGIFDDSYDNSTNSHGEMTRAQIANIILKLTAIETDSNLSPIVDDTSWSDAFLTAIDAGYYIGDGAGNFYPDEPITIEQLATVLVRMLGLEVDEEAVVDGQISDWAKGYVAAAIAGGLLSPDIRDYTQPAQREVLVEVTYTANEHLEAEKPNEQQEETENTCANEALGIEEALLDLEGDGRLTISFSTAVDPESIRADSIRIHGFAPNPGDTHIELSEDGKHLTVTFGETFKQALSNITRTTLVLFDLRTVCGQESMISMSIDVLNAPFKPITAQPSYPPSNPGQFIKIHGITVTEATYSTMSLEFAGWDYISVIAIEDGDPAPTIEELRIPSYSAVMPYVCTDVDISGLDQSPSIVDIRLDHFFMTHYDPSKTYTFYVIGKSDPSGSNVSDIITATY